MALKTPLPDIMVAPNGARRKRSDHPALPVTIEQTVETAKLCYEAGAGGLHAHVRDENEGHSLDVGLYRELLKELAVVIPDMPVQITTESMGQYSWEEQRKLVEELRPEYISVALGEMAPDHRLETGKAFYHWAVDNDVQVQHLLYLPEEVERFYQLVDDGVVPEQNLKILFILGKYATQQESAPKLLPPFIKNMKASGVKTDWAVCASGKAETKCLKRAIELGGKVRVGFENSLWNADGSIANDNAERVREIAAL